MPLDNSIKLSISLKTVRYQQTNIFMPRPVTVSMLVVSTFSHNPITSERGDDKEINKLIDQVSIKSLAFVFEIKNLFLISKCM